MTFFVIITDEARSTQGDPASRPDPAFIKALPVMFSANVRGAA
jgi:hypothetical protein